MVAISSCINDHPLGIQLLLRVGIFAIEHSPFLEWLKMKGIPVLGLNAVQGPRTSPGQMNVSQASSCS